MATQIMTTALRSSRASVVKYDILAALNAGALARAGLSKDLAQRLTLLILARYNWATNEISAGHQQLSMLWSVDLRRVKRILADLKSAGVLAVKRAGRRGLVTVYAMSIDRIAELTRPFWRLLGSDIEARLDAHFPEADAAREKAQPTETKAQPATEPRAFARPTAVDDPIQRAVAPDVPPAAFERWIRPLEHYVEDDILIVKARTRFIAHYVERQFGAKIERAARSVLPHVHRCRFVAPDTRGAV